VRALSTPERRSTWRARLRKFSLERESLREKGRSLRRIDEKISSLKMSLDKLKKKERGNPL